MAGSDTGWSLFKAASIHTVLAVLVMLCLVAGARADSNFSQYPGFAEYFAANPRSDSPAGAADQALLHRHRPRFFLPRGHSGLISFYDDYIAQGVLTDGADEVVSRNVTREILNRHKRDSGAVFRHIPSSVTSRGPVVFGRVDRSSVALGSNGSETMTFLTYHAVFRNSGLIAGISWWQSGAVRLAADPRDWHQLDHYTAATVVLDARGKAVALMLQQHNYNRTYLFGEGVDLPADGRPLVDVAIRSNELYPHAQGRRTHRAVRFLEVASLRFMLGATVAPTFAGSDITDPDGESDYALEFLPQTDAFYSFQGFLGERRMLPGRDGPPGADYNTLPALKPLGRQLAMGYWREGNAGDIERMEQTYGRNGDLLGFIAGQARVLTLNRDCLALRKKGCRLQ